MCDSDFHLLSSHLGKSCKELKKIILAISPGPREASKAWKVLSKLLCRSCPANNITFNGFVGVVIVMAHISESALYFTKM